ncbi:MAG: chalcone isomerase family protein [Desulfobacteraceae bacterium]|jgi:hypothetical protein
MIKGLGKVLAITLLIWTSVSANVFGIEIEEITFEDRCKVGDTILHVKGVGLLRYMVFVKVYVAALYLKQGVPAEQALSDTPKRLEIHYFKSIKAEDFALSTREMIAKNVNSETLERLQPRIEEINALYEDIRPGDRYSLTYVVGKGTELALNGKPKGVIAGSGFASAMFSIWLGLRPLDKSLKKSLLGEP